MATSSAQAMKLACFPFLDRFGMVEIVDRKNAATYARIAAANGCAPAPLTMVGDRFFEDVGPVMRLGGRGIHVPQWPLGDVAAVRSIYPVLPDYCPGTGGDCGGRLGWETASRLVASLLKRFAMSLAAAFDSPPAAPGPPSRPGCLSIASPQARSSSVLPPW
jgi:hypothetical protein